MAEPSQNQIAEAVESFINAQTWEECKRIVEAKRDLLLTDAADQVFASALEQYRDDANITQFLEDHRDLLMRCQHDGIEIAFADRLHSEELQSLLNEIERLSNPSDMSRRADLCRAALRLVKSDTQPQLWAYLHFRLAISSAQSLQGESADNLEQAISHYEQALEVFTCQNFPEQWALTQNNLATAYRERIRGEHADNLEQAISHCEQALQVFTRQDSPQDWAMTQNNLATAYSQRVRDERADNLEQAISHYEQALEVYTRQNFPEQWAKIQHNLANTNSERIRGERADNLEQAIYHFEQALEVRTRQDYPIQWAATQDNLGSAYRRCIRGERADNLEQAISHLELALEVYTRQAYPIQWAATQNNLGNAYRERIRGERAENLEQAISHYEQALQVYIRQDFPERWAGAQNNLATAYRERIRGERAENLEQAISHYQEALEARTRQAFPEDWAMTQYNLGNAYRKRIRGERAENLVEAILHYQYALEVRTPTSFPQDCRDTAYELGRLLYDERRFLEARQALSTAHQAVEALRGEVQRDIAKRSLAEENADLYARLVSCCLKEEDESAAFKYIVAGKGRAFVDLLATARIDLSAASANDPALSDDLRKAQELRQKIDTILATLTGESALSAHGSALTTGNETSGRTPLPLDVLRTQLSALQAQEAHQWEEMAYKYPALTATQKAPILSVEQARTLAAELNATLVEYYRHAEGWCGFVVTPNAMHHIPLPLLTEELLERMDKWMLRLDYPKGRNRSSYNRLSEWHDAVIAPLEAYLPQERPIVLAPFDELHVLPLAAALNPQTKRYLAEDYQIAFAPSLSALYVTRDQAHRTGNDGQVALHRLLNVVYPGSPGSGHYLPHVLPEAQAIARHFAQVTSLYQEEATPEAVLAQSHDQDVVHFGCHGWFDPEQPEQSGLMLAGGWLTVQRIITELFLQQARLATLGACLSGRAALRRGDEHVGLMQAMLTTGVQAVVASLWPVDDAATRAMFETFYAELAAGRSPAKAMQEAARFVRVQPGWAHPFYWAAFQVSGLAHTKIESA